MSLNRKSRINPEEYLRIERAAEQRSEYFDGEAFAMAGASRRHNRIVTNLVAGLDNQLKSRPCNVYSSDLRVKISATQLYTYPDVVVTCGEEQFEDEHNDTLLNPTILVEVLSDSTEAYNRGKKFEQYQQIESLKEYILVAQDKWRVEQYVRQSNNQWVYSEIHGVESYLTMATIGCNLSLSEIYDKVD